ncbi:MAG: hypothetical protein MSH49_06595, partial [[Eubacterium] saphenum]|nr:hypothetical protein [[Eubacterium] saphenum]
QRGFGEIAKKLDYRAAVLSSCFYAITHEIPDISRKVLKTHKFGFAARFCGKSPRSRVIARHVLSSRFHAITCEIPDILRKVLKTREFGFTARFWGKSP